MKSLLQIILSSKECDQKLVPQRFGLCITLEESSKFSPGTFLSLELTFKAQFVAFPEGAYTTYRGDAAQQAPYRCVFYLT